MKCRANYDAFMEAALRGAPKGNINNNPAAKAEKSNPTNSSELTSTPKKPAPDTRKKLAEKAGVSEHKAQQALHVVRKATPEVNAAVRAGDMSLKDAVKTVVPAKPKGNKNAAKVEKTMGTNSSPSLLQSPAPKAEKSITPKAAHSTSETSAPAKPKRAPAKDEKLAKKAGVSEHTEGK